MENQTSQRRRRLALSAREVQLALQKGEKRVLHDGGGLQLNVHGRNKGAWVYRGKVRGSRNNIQTSWPAPETSLSEARRLRDEFCEQLRAGINPNEARRLARQQEELASKTFAVVAEEYFASREDLGEATLKLERGRVKNHLAPLSSMRIADIRRMADIKPILDRILQTGSRETAVRVSGLLRRIFSFAVAHEYIENSPASELKRLLPRRKAGEQKHHPAVTDVKGFASVLTRLWSRLDAGHSNHRVQAAIKLTCYVPLRNSNLVEAKWKDVDFEKGIWHFPETKNSLAYDVPMTRQIREILEELRTRKRDEWCFPSSGASGHLTGGGMSDFLRDAGIPNREQSLHGFRASFKTIAMEYGIPYLLTEHLLFHKVGSTVEQAYNHVQYLEPTKLALQWWDDTVDALRKGQEVPEIPEKLKDRYR